MMNVRKSGTGRAGSLLLVIFFTIIIHPVFPAGAQTGCIRAKHHYEGHPKPNVYVVTVTSLCQERRIVKVRILDAIYGEVLHEEEFSLGPGESRSVSISFSGEKFFSYAVSNHPPD